jgi:hypothetical protein
MNVNAGAEAVQSAEGNMSGAAMRGTVALPGSETSSRTKGSRRNLGDLLSPAAAQAVSGRVGSSAERSHLGRQEESDGCVVCAGQRPDREGSSPSGARMRGAVSKSGGNASLAEARGRYGDV